MAKKQKPESEKKKAKKITPIPAETVAIEENKQEEVKAKNPHGRPTIYTEELAQIILDRLTEGESLARICADEDMPGRATVYRWVKADKSFRDSLSRARKFYAISLVDNLAESAAKLQKKLEDGADTWESNDRIRALSDVTRTVFNIMSWTAGRFNKKLFGDHQTQKVKQDTTLTLPDKRSTDEIFESIKNKANLPQNKKKDDDK